MERPLLVLAIFANVFAVAMVDSLKISANYIDAEKKSFSYKLKSEFKLVCNVSSAESEYKVEWLKEGRPVADVLHDRAKPAPPPTETRAGDTRATLAIGGGVLDDAGNYTCVARPLDGGDVAEAEFHVFSTVQVKLPSNVNVVEGEPLTLTCLARGNPLPPITWRVGNRTYDESEGRVRLSDGEYEGRAIPQGVLVIDNVTMEDRGTYTCVGTDAAGNVETSECMVRIGGKYAALWPFLGICAEVIVLCAIIVIYEKKRNKTELEESDTDQSPDQKNTPDHGKEANLRHRQ